LRNPLSKSHSSNRTIQAPTGRLLVAEAEAVAAGTINVQLRRGAGSLEAEIDLGQSLRNVGAIVVGRGEKRRRRLLGRLDVDRASGIDQCLEIRL
jgi:hypothetical protein